MKKSAKPGNSEHQPPPSISVRGIDYKLAYSILLKAYLARPIPPEVLKSFEDIAEQSDSSILGADEKLEDQKLQDSETFVSVSGKPSKNC